jgi:serine/threonine protein kinase
VDFGLAVSPGQMSLGGTPGYMAPEAAAGRSVDKRSDVYSSCVVLAELLKGARLFTTASSLALAREQASAAPALGGIEAPVAAVLSTGLHPRPDDRPADAQTLLTQLESAIEETHGRRWLAAAGLGAIGSTAATIAAGIELTTATATASTGTTTAAAAKPGTSTLSRGKLIAAGAVVIAALAAFLLLRPEPPQPAAAQSPTPPAAAAAAASQATQPAITAGVYLIHFLSQACGQYVSPLIDIPTDVIQKGNSVYILGGTGPLNADGSFVATGYNTTVRGVFATEGGQSVIRDGAWNRPGICDATFTATKQ